MNNTSSHCFGEQAVKIEYTSAEIGLYSFLCTIFCLVAFFGNVLVIIAILCTRQIRKHEKNFYLLSLAVADALLASSVVPFSLTNQLTGNWPFGIFYCRVYLSLDVCFCTASISHIAVIGLDRYVAIKFPLFYRTHRPKSWIKKIIVSVSVGFEVMRKKIS